MIILGFSLSFFQAKEEVLPEIKPISMERNCLIESIYYEARNTSLKERQAVMEVVLNRTKHKHYPSTICEVVQQPYQMSYRNNSKANARLLPELGNMNYLDRKAYLEIESLVDSRFISGEFQGSRVLPENTLHYHLKVMDKIPRWSTSPRKLQVKGLDKGFKHHYYEYIG